MIQNEMFEAARVARHAGNLLMWLSRKSELSQL